MIISLDLSTVYTISEKINQETENIGARRLQTVMSKLLNEILFDIPEKIGPNAKIIIKVSMFLNILICFLRLHPTFRLSAVAFV